MASQMSCVQEAPTTHLRVSDGEGPVNAVGRTTPTAAGRPPNAGQSTIRKRRQRPCLLVQGSLLAQRPGKALPRRAALPGRGRYGYSTSGLGRGGSGPTHTPGQAPLTRTGPGVKHRSRVSPARTPPSGTTRPFTLRTPAASRCGSCCRKGHPDPKAVSAHNNRRYGARRRLN